MRAAIVSSNLAAIDLLCRSLVERLGVKLAWTNQDALCAIDQAKIDAPDLLIVDLSSKSNEAVRLIEKTSRSCPVLAVVEAGEDFSTQIYDALGRGAMDAARLPRMDAAGKVVEDQDFLSKVETIARIRGAHLTRKNRTRPAPSPAPAGVAQPILVAVGSSTGGPQSLATILAKLSTDLPAAFVVIQHLDERFAADMAAWLDPLTPLDVLVAHPGAALTQGVVWVADPTAHLIARIDGALGYEPDRPPALYRPSIDRFFRSLAAHHPSPGVAVLLSGMGRDGADGLLTLRELGWRTIAQDESTSAVYGMPRAAAELGAAEQILPDFHIARAIESAVLSLR
jgi:two-component system response regulator WspF